MKILSVIIAASTIAAVAGVFLVVYDAIGLFLGGLAELADRFRPEGER